jgi:HEAT repeat protein
MLRGLNLAALGLALLLPSAGPLRADPIPNPAAPATITEVGGKSLKKWLEDFKDPDPSVREEAIRAVTFFPNANEAVPPLIGQLHDGDASPRSAAVLALAMIKIDDKDRPRVIEALGARLAGAEPQSPIRFQVAVVLGGFGKDARGALDALKQGVEDQGSFQIRLACCADLAAAGMTDKGPDPKVTHVLLTALGDRAAGVRLQAIMTMAEMGRADDPALLQAQVAALKHATKDRDKTVAIWAHLGLMGLDKIDDDGVKFLKQCTNTDELLRVRVQAVRALGMVGSKDNSVLPAIEELLKDAEPQMAASACLALAEADDPAGVEPLAGVAQTAARSAVVRVQAVRALGALALKSKKAVDPLIDLLKDKDHEVAANACMALGSLTDPPLKVDDELTKLSKNKDIDEDVRRAAEAALEMLHKPKK